MFSCEERQRLFRFQADFGKHAMAVVMLFILNRINAIGIGVAACPLEVKCKNKPNNITNVSIYYSKLDKGQKF